MLGSAKKNYFSHHLLTLMSFQTHKTTWLIFKTQIKILFMKPDLCPSIENPCTTLLFYVYRCVVMMQRLESPAEIQQHHWN